MMTRDQLLFHKLAEEACEVAHVAMKIMQLGAERSHDGLPTNIEKLRNEIGDFQAIVELLDAKGMLPKWSVEKRVAYTLDRWAGLEKWAKVAQELGNVEPDQT